jgi:fibronectin-binding autotransporter adhesin
MNRTKYLLLVTWALGVTATPAFAQSVWQPAGGGSWASAGNWSAGVPSPGTAAQFNHPAFGGGTVTLDGNAAAAGLSFTSSAAGFATLTIDPGSVSSSTLTLSSGLVASDAHIQSNVPVLLASSSTWSATAGSTITALGLRPVAAASLTHTIDGSVRIGTGGIDLSQTTFNLTVGGTGTLGVIASQSWRVGRVAPASQSLTFQSGSAVSLGTGTTLTLAPDNPGAVMSSILLNGTLTGDGGLSVAATAAGATSTLMGSGLVELGGAAANTHSGTVSVSGGTLYLRKAQALAGTVVGVSGGQLYVQAGLTNALAPTTALTLTGDGNYNYAIPTGTGSVIPAPSAHTQTFASVAFGSGTNGSFQTGAGTITVTGTFTASGQGAVTVTPGGTLTVHRLDLPAVAVRGEVFVRADPGFGFLNVGSGGLNMVGRSITLTAPVASNFGGRLVLSGDVTASGSSAFTGINTGAHQVRLNGVRTFDVATNGLLAITGASVTNDGATAGGISKTGAGTLRLGSVGSFSGPLTVSAGRVTMATGASVSDSAPVILNGGQLSTAGLVGSSAGAGAGETVGFLNVTAAGSSLDLGTGAHVFRAAGLSGQGLDTFPAGANLTVFGWQGPAGGPGTAGRVVFTSDAGFTADNLSRMTFDGYATGAAVIGYTGFGGGFELVPVPEPGTILGVAALALAAARFRPRRKNVGCDPAKRR